jgi:hypothetical protein
MKTLKIIGWIVLAIIAIPILGGCALLLLPFLIPLVLVLVVGVIALVFIAILWEAWND